MNFSAESSLWVPVWPGVCLDHVYLCCQYDLQHHMSHHYTLWWVTYNYPLVSSSNPLFSSVCIPSHSLLLVYMCLCCLSSHCNLTLLYCLPVRCRLCEFAAVVPDTQTQWVASQTPTLLLSLPRAHQASIYFCSLIVSPSSLHSHTKVGFYMHFTCVVFPRLVF